MTLQVGVRAADGSIVLAGDTKARVVPSVPETSRDVTGIINHPKIMISEHSGLAFAFAGHKVPAAEPCKELATYLESLDKIPDYLETNLKEWGDAYFGKQGGTRQRQYPMFSIMVVNPHTQFCCFSVVHVNLKTGTDVSDSMMVNGLGTNAAVFWLEHLKADKRSLDLPGATGAVVTTILTAGEIDPHNIGGLEVYQYTKDVKTWKQTQPDDLARFQERFRKFDNRIKRMAYRMAL
ncbi:MAG TPA: hypothetical protein VJN43_07180 [Bryobacteraceae bacterium]|nr:hypothetical protein [Bryobacteraceae bacterium]